MSCLVLSSALLSLFCLAAHRVVCIGVVLAML